MQLSGIPAKITVPFADSGTKNTIPTAASPTPGLASYTLGFPPVTMTAIVAGGIPPAGQDFNGVLNAITQATRWAMAGGVYSYDSAFSTAVGGYPNGALLASANGTGMWRSTVDNNTSNPDAGGANWVAGFSAPLAVGTATASQHAVQYGQLNQGQCYFQYSSTTTVSLVPYNGQNLVINGIPQQVPTGGIAISNTGLAASTLYYFYAAMSGGSMILEASTTGHVLGTNGVQVKSGDATRTLVGMAFTNTSTPGQFVQTLSSRCVASWYNRKPSAIFLIAASGSTFTNTSLGNVLPAANITFVGWVEDAIQFGSSGSAQGTTAGTNLTIGVAQDGVLQLNQEMTIPSANGFVPYSLNLSGPIGEGFHTISLQGSISASSAAVAPGTNYVYVRQ